LGELGWVTLFNGPTAFTPASQQLRLIGVEPRVEVVVDGFLAMPFLVAGTNRVALIQQRLAHLLAATAGVRVLPCPFEVVPLTEALWWHPMYRTDPAHAWLRSVFQAAGIRAAGIQAAGIRAAGIRAAGIRAAGIRAAGIRAAGARLA
jgi:DNA-binding transcriptional LysR family regulator